MSVAPIRVLFVCTGNSCRSIMAEAILRDRGGSAFEVHSAGSHPNGLNPRTTRLLDEVGLDGSFARSKSVDEFRDQAFDYVITVCDQARQVCPVFPGEGQRLHWGYPDPAEATGTEDEVMDAYRQVFTGLAARIGLFIPLALRERDEAIASSPT